MNHFTRIFTTAVFAITCAIAVTACDESTAASDDETSEISSDAAKSSSSVTQSSPSETKETSSSSVKAESSSSEGLITRFQSPSDDVGFYATLIILNPKLAAPKGKVEIMWYSHNAVSNTEEQVLWFVADYETNESSNTYNIYSTFNGMIEQNNRNQAELKIKATVGATIRGERLEIYYTPDGGEKQLIKTANAEDYKPKN